MNLSYSGSRRARDHRHVRPVAGRARHPQWPGDGRGAQGTRGRRRLEGFRERHRRAGHPGHRLADQRLVRRRHLHCRGHGRYNRGMLAGSLRDRRHEPAGRRRGNPGEGPTPTLQAFGGGSLTLTLAPWLAATAECPAHSRTGEVEVTGRIGLPAALDVFPGTGASTGTSSPSTLDIPIVGVAVARPTDRDLRDDRRRHGPDRGVRAGPAPRPPPRGHLQPRPRGRHARRRRRRVLRPGRRRAPR